MVWPSDGEVGDDGLAASQALISASGGQFGLEFVGVEAPEFDQLADAGVEQVFALLGQLLGFADQGGQFFTDLVAVDPGKNGPIQCRQFGRLPGMIGAVQAVEFAQDAGDGLTPCAGSALTTSTSTRVPKT
jgi:hypothetical protein